MVEKDCPQRMATDKKGSYNTTMIEYPTIPRDDRKNVKIKTNDIQEIIQLYNLGMSLRNISTQYGVSIPTIRRYTDPEYKERQYESIHI